MKTSNYKTLLCAFFAGLTLAASSQSIGEVRGVIKDKDDLQPVPYANVAILQGNQLIGGTQTDEKGRYSYKPLVPGTYELRITEAGHKTQPVNKVKVVPNEATYIDVKLTANDLGTVIVVAEAIDYTKTGVEKTMFNQVSIDAEELNRNASYNKGNVKEALESMTSDVISTGDGEVHFRGARGDAAGYFVDGVRTIHPGIIPGLSIENISVFPGGVPAMYGDLSSGVVIVTTMGYFSGIREKNVRNTARNEAKEKEKAEKKAKEDEENRAKEIEEEKAKDESQQK